MRGIDAHHRRTTISPLYAEHRALFPAWPQDLYSHLAGLAESAADDLAPFDGEPAWVNYDWYIADLTNGRPGCGSGADVSPVTTISSRGTTLNSMDCRVMPLQARRLVEVVVARRLEFIRQGRLGQVTVLDIPTSQSAGATDEDGG